MLEEARSQVKMGTEDQLRIAQENDALKIQMAQRIAFAAAE